MVLIVKHICGYYSQRAHELKRRPEIFWDAYFFTWSVKRGTFRRTYLIHYRDGRRESVTASYPPKYARHRFGAWIEQHCPSLVNEKVYLVPVPSKDAVGDAPTYRTLEMVEDAASHIKRDDIDILDALAFDKSLPPAHQGGRMSKEECKDHLLVSPKVKDKKIVLVDDIVTSGSTLRACKAVIESRGGEVIIALVCARTVSDASEPAFKTRGFELDD